MAETGINLEGHIPPHNIEAEQACLGSCLIDPEAFDKVASALSGADDFYRVSHSVIFSAMIDLAENNSNIDLITVSSYLKDHGQLETCGGAGYLDSLISMVGTSAFVANYARIVADKENSVQRSEPDTWTAVYSRDSGSFIPAAASLSA